MLMELQKRCARCNADKPVSHFYNSPATSDGMRSCCKACNAAKCRAQRAANKLRPQDRAGTKKRCCRCKTVFPVSEFHKDSGSTDGLYRFCKQCNVLHARACKYGLTRPRVAEMLRQKHCEACWKSLPTNAEKHIDHHHADGAVRGILCERCNTTLGKCEENPEVLMGICRYITRTVNVDYRKQPYLEQILPHMDSSSAGPLTPEEPARTCPTNTPLQPTSPQP